MYTIYWMAVQLYPELQMQLARTIVLTYQLALFVGDSQIKMYYLEYECLADKADNI